MPQPVAIVTGAARGIGKSIALTLARRSTAVLVADSSQQGRQTVDEMKEQGLEAIFCQADVSVPQSVRQVVETAQSHYRRLDWIVNNAGISAFKPIDEISIDEFDHILAVNLRAAFLFAKFGAPLLRQSPQAAIVNIASTRALMSEPHNEAYAAAKAGLLGLTHALANSLGPAVRINAVCPGWIATENTPALSPADHAQHPVGRVGLPSDIANMTAFLLSAEASFISGQAFVVDGGMTKKMIYTE